MLRNDVARLARSDVMFAHHVPQAHIITAGNIISEATSFARQGKHHSTKAKTALRRSFALELHSPRDTKNHKVQTGYFYTIRKNERKKICLMKTGFALMKSLALLVNEDGAVNCA